MKARTLDRIHAPEARFFLAQGHGVAYNLAQQHPPRLSTMRTMGGYFFFGNGTMKLNKLPFTHLQRMEFPADWEQKAVWQENTP